jgi:hypothetical protein
MIRKIRSDVSAPSKKKIGGTSHSAESTEATIMILVVRYVAGLRCAYSALVRSRQARTPRQTHKVARPANQLNVHDNGTVSARATTSSRPAINWDPRIPGTSLISASTCAW